MTCLVNDREKGYLFLSSPLKKMSSNLALVKYRDGVNQFGGELISFCILGSFSLVVGQDLEGIL